MAIHRYSIPTSEIVRSLLDVGDCQEIQTYLVGENLVVDVIEPSNWSIEEQLKFDAEMDELVAPREKPPLAEPEHQSEPEHARKGGDLAKRAGILCGEKAFQVWADVPTSDAAKAFIYHRCGIESRVDLDHEPEAAAKFRDMIAEYDVWLSAPE
jgi:hypothetical protein